MWVYCRNKSNTTKWKLLLMLNKCVYFSIGTVHEDITTDVLGNIGSWQWMVVFVSTAFMMTSMFDQYEDIFLLAPPRNVECDLPKTSSTLNSTLCTYTIINSTKEYKCNKWHVKVLWFIWISKTVIFLKYTLTTVCCRNIDIKCYVHMSLCRHHRNSYGMS